MHHVHEGDALACIEREIDVFTNALDFPANLRDAVRYAALGPGKRLRPLLAWRCAEALGRSGSVSLRAGLAVELVHAFSLVHDDLPAIDNDDLRRGRPTLHKHAGEAMAVLAGDAMLTLAFDVAIGDGSDRRGSRLARELVSGTRDMIAGQVYDTLGGFDIGVPDADRLRTIHQLKTGALIRAACRMGAIAALPESLEPVDERRFEAINGFAQAVGLMFQIVDDLIDVEQPPEHAGKRTGKDADAGKLTFPVVHGIARSREFAETLCSEAQKSLEPLGADGETLRSLARQMASRTR